MMAWRACRQMVVAAVVGVVAVSGCYFGPSFPDPPGAGPKLPASGVPFSEELVTTTYEPAPVSGGTLALLDEHTALAVDPDRERVWRVALDGFTGADGYAQFAAGSRPRRAVVDAEGTVHVLLRGTGQVAHFPASSLRFQGAVPGMSLEPVCLEPRDLALDPAGGALLVSCRDGTVLRLGAAGGPPTVLASDLRDLLPGPGGLAYTTFQKAELHTADGAVLAPRVPAANLPNVPEAEVAWRTVSTPVGALMLHQLASTDSIAVASSGTSTGSGGSPYGGSNFGVLGNGCQPGVVTTAVTLFSPRGGVSTARVADLLGVDAAAWLADGSTLLVAVAGAAGTGLTVYAAALDERGAFADETLCSRVIFSSPGGQFTGVKFLADGTLVAHDRQSSSLAVLKAFVGGGIAFVTTQRVTYAFDSVDSPGSLLFHLAPSARDPAVGATLACASCHPEAVEDGHTWLIDGQPRRTQSLAGGVSGRAPFHWQGDRPTLEALLADTFTHRMGGGTPPPLVVSSLRHFLDGVPALKTTQLPADRRALGQAAFAKAGCAGCHQGPQLGGGLADVGTGGTFKVPTLIGLHARTALMHSGCAPTLGDRFDGTPCGGTAHGDLSRLTAGELDWLKAYLQTL